VNPETQQLTVGFRYVVPFIPDAMKTAVQLFEAHFKSSGRQPYELDKNPSGFGLNFSFAPIQIIKWPNTFAP